jgi:hypothetical protein
VRIVAPAAMLVKKIMVMPNRLLHHNDLICRSSSQPMAVPPAHVVADLRTDHAGETGAICTYHGAAFPRPGTVDFAQRYLATESSPAANRSLAVRPQRPAARLAVGRLADRCPCPLCWPKRGVRHD